MRTFLLLLGILGICALDLWTKRWVTGYLSDTPLLIVGDFLRLELHHNTGIAFSLPVPFWIQIVASSCILIGLTIWWYRSHDALMDFGMVLLYGGALGNLYERIMQQSVTDFIAVWQLPIWNVSDMAIFVGVCLLILREWLMTGVRHS